MEVNLAMDVTAKELFDVITASLEYDIKTSTGKTVHLRNIKPGYTYTKHLNSKMGHGTKVQVTIEELTEPFVYAAKFDSQTGVNRIRYEIEELEDNQVGLTYEESFEGSKKMYDWNTKLLTWVLSIPNKRNLKKRFRELESSIIENRDKSKEEKDAEALDYYD